MMRFLLQLINMPADHPVPLNSAWIFLTDNIIKLFHPGIMHGTGIHEEQKLKLNTDVSIF